MRTTVRDVMTTRVVAVRKNATFKDIATLLTEYRVSAFPVLDEAGKVIGVVSEADMLTKEALVADMGVQATRLGRIAGSPYHDEFAKAAAVTAGDLMTKPPVVVTPDEPVTSAARLMYHGRVKRLPVVGEKGQLIGIVSRADVLSVYSRPDSEIQQEITKNVIQMRILCRSGPIRGHRLKRHRHPRGLPGKRGQGTRHRGRGLARRRGRFGARPADLSGRKVTRCIRTLYCPPGS